MVASCRFGTPASRYLLLVVEVLVWLAALRVLLRMRAGTARGAHVRRLPIILLVAGVIAAGIVIDRTDERERAVASNESGASNAFGMPLAAASRSGERVVLRGWDRRRPGDRRPRRDRGEPDRPPGHRRDHRVSRPAAAATAGCCGRCRAWRVDHDLDLRARVDDHGRTPAGAP